MSEKVLVSGFVFGVRYTGVGPPDVIVNNRAFDVPAAEADKALAAKRAGKQVEIVDGNGCGWGDRTVRLVPVVVVRDKGFVADIHLRKDGGALVGVCGRDRSWSVEADVGVRKVAALAMHDSAEVEIVSVDGGPDMVRRVS